MVQSEVAVLRTAEDREDDAVRGFHEIEVGLGERCWLSVVLVGW